MDHNHQDRAKSEETPQRSHPTSLPPPKDSLREVGLVAAILLGLVVAIGGIWMYQEQAGETSTARPSTASKKDVREIKTVAARPSPPPASGDFDVYFRSGQDALTSKARSVLAEQAARMAGHKRITVLLHGHTDRRGSTDSNEALGRRRGRAVEAELVKLGVPKTAIQVLSPGETQALCRSKTEACHRKNRRVHISWNTTSDLTSSSAHSKPAPGAARQERRLAAEDRPRTEPPHRTPVHAAQAQPE